MVPNISSTHGIAIIGVTHPVAGMTTMGKQTVSDNHCYVNLIHLNYSIAAGPANQVELLQ